MKIFLIILSLAFSSVLTIAQISSSHKNDTTIKWCPPNDTITQLLKDYKSYQSGKNEIEKINNTIEKNNETLSEFKRDDEQKNFWSKILAGMGIVTIIGIWKWIKR